MAELGPQRLHPRLRRPAAPRRPRRRQRNRALALFGAVSSGGASIGLLLGGLLTVVWALIGTPDHGWTSARMAVIVSVYAAHAVPGEFLPDAPEAFLTSAVVSAIAALVALAGLTMRRRPVAVPGPEDLEEVVLADAA